MLFLCDAKNDETLDSEWCMHEGWCLLVQQLGCRELMCLWSHFVCFAVKEAKRLGRQIICVVDADKQLAKSVIDHYMAQGLSWLFDQQVYD